VTSPLQTRVAPLKWACPYLLGIFQVAPVPHLIAKAKAATGTLHAFRYYKTEQSFLIKPQSTSHSACVTLRLAATASVHRPVRVTCIPAPSLMSPGLRCEPCPWPSGTHVLQRSLIQRSPGVFEQAARPRQSSPALPLCCSASAFAADAASPPVLAGAPRGPACDL